VSFLSYRRRSLLPAPCPDLLRGRFRMPMGGVAPGDRRQARRPRLEERAGGRAVPGCLAPGSVAQAGDGDESAAALGSRVPLLRRASRFTNLYVASENRADFQR